MAWLKVYEWERNKWPEFRKIEIARSDAPKYWKKFARHFKVSVPKLSKHIKRDGGTYYSGIQVIRLPHTTSFGTIIHEFAHHLTEQRYGSREHHGKKFKHELKRVYSFAKRYINN